MVMARGGMGCAVLDDIISFVREVRRLDTYVCMYATGREKDRAKEGCSWMVEDDLCMCMSINDRLTSTPTPTPTPTPIPHPHAVAVTYKKEFQRHYPCNCPCLSSWTAIFDDELTSGIRQGVCQGSWTLWSVHARMESMGRDVLGQWAWLGWDGMKCVCFM